MYTFNNNIPDSRTPVTKPTKSLRNLLEIVTFITDRIHNHMLYSAGFLESFIVFNFGFGIN